MNKIISKDGTAIVYERSGEGPAIIPLQPVVWANVKLAPLLEQLT